MIMLLKGLIELPPLLASALSSCTTSLLRNVRRRRTYASLSSLDDRTLQDIGLNRSMIMSIAFQAVRLPAGDSRVAFKD